MSLWWEQRISQRNQLTMLKGSSRCAIVVHCMASTACRLRAIHERLHTIGLLLTYSAVWPLHTAMHSKWAPGEALR